MWVYLCVCVCLCACGSVGLWVCCVCGSVCVCTLVCFCISMCTVCVCLFVSVCVCLFVSVYVRLCVYVSDKSKHLMLVGRSVEWKIQILFLLSNFLKIVFKSKRIHLKSNLLQKFLINISKRLKEFGRVKKTFQQLL